MQPCWEKKNAVPEMRHCWIVSALTAKLRIARGNGNSWKDCGKQRPLLDRQRLHLRLGPLLRNRRLLVRRRRQRLKREKIQTI
jgi:hypothetical protein